LIPEEVGTHISGDGTLLNESGKQVREECLDHCSALAQEGVRLPSLGCAFAWSHPFQSVTLDQRDVLEVLREDVLQHVAPATWEMSYA
jgi:hypothetical protein